MTLCVINDTTEVRKIRKIIFILATTSLILANKSYAQDCSNTNIYTTQESFLSFTTRHYQLRQNATVKGNVKEDCEIQKHYIEFAEKYRKFLEKCVSLSASYNQETVNINYKSQYRQNCDNM